MHWIYVLAANVNEDISLIEITEAEARHAFSVLRLRIGDAITAFDGRGSLYHGKLDVISKKGGIIKIIKKEIIRKSKIRITLAAAIPKKDKFEEIVDKATQLGVEKIIPLITQRTQVKLDTKKEQEKLARWRKKAIEAAKQCSCAYVPEISEIAKYESVLCDSENYKRRLIGSLHKNAKPVKQILRKGKPGDLIVFIGPEGDFTDKEMSLAVKNGFTEISLGRNILRCETATTKIVAIINYEWTD